MDGTICLHCAEAVARAQECLATKRKPMTKPRPQSHSHPIEQLVSRCSYKGCDSPTWLHPPAGSPSGLCKAHTQDAKALKINGARRARYEKKAG